MQVHPENDDLLPLAGYAHKEEGVDLLAIIAAIIAEWRLILGIAALIAIAGIIFTFVTTSQFVATASFLPEVDRSESDSLAALFSPRSPGGIFVGLLQSREVANDVINRAHLFDKYHTDSYEKARASLSAQSSFKIDTDSFVVITVKDANAKDATDIANAYLNALDDLNIEMAKDQGRQLETFFHEQLELEKADLAKAEDKLERTQQQTGLVQPESQMQIGLNAIASVRSQIQELQVQLSSALESETDQNPQVQRLRAEIRQLQNQESRMENGSQAPVGAAPPAGQIPRNNLDYVRAQREVRTYDALVNSLSSQFENARLSENLSRPAFQTIDHAVIPERKSWPPRRLFVLLSLFIGLLVGLSVSIVKLAARRIARDPANQESLNAIREAFGK